VAVKVYQIYSLLPAPLQNSLDGLVFLLVLLDYHDDVATLRRGMVETGLMTRMEGIYQRK